jgi:hypothetical protein
LTIAAHAWITLTFRWNSPGCTGVFTSAIAAMRIVVLVSPTSLPGAAVPEAGVPPEALEPEALGDEPPAADVDGDDDDEQPAASAMTASALAAMTRSRVRRRPDAPLVVRDLSWPFQITMLRPHN